MLLEKKLIDEIKNNVKLFKKIKKYNTSTDIIKQVKFIIDEIEFLEFLIKQEILWRIMKR